MSEAHADLVEIDVDDIHDAKRHEDERAPRPGDRADEVGPVLLHDSSREFVRSLREPLHALTLDSDLLATNPRPMHEQPVHDEPAEPACATSEHAMRLRAQRFRRQVASIARAIEMLENTLDQRSVSDSACDLGEMVDDAVKFLAPFAARHRRRLMLAPAAPRRLGVEIDRLATWQTIIVLMAERLMAIPEGETLRIEVADGAADCGREIGREVRRSGAFSGLGAAGDRTPASLRRLLDSDAIQRSGARLRVMSAIEVALTFEVDARCESASAPMTAGPGDVQPPSDAEPSVASISSVSR